jgi:uncharacterized protein (TIGR02145 family)
MSITQNDITVRIPAATLNNDAGELPVFVSGTPTAATAGKAFDIPVTVLGNQLYVRVNVGFGAYAGTPSIAEAPSRPSLLSAGGDSVWLQFQGYNLGADTSLDPFTLPQQHSDTISHDIKGWWFQWGRPEDGHQWRSSGVTTTLATNPPGHSEFIVSILIPSDWLLGGGGANRWGGETQTKQPNDPCPAGWKVPSQAQWNSIFGNSLILPSSATANTWKWESDTYGGGYRVGSSMFLPAAGYRDRNGTLHPSKDIGYYWSNTIFGVQSNYVNFSPDYASTITNTFIFRAFGLSVRCVAE